MDSQLACDRDVEPYQTSEHRPAPAVAHAQDPDGIPWSRYTDRICYSACNEDTYSELLALRLRPGSRVLCITGGGGRVLNLLLDRPAEIWAVDVNPCQGALLELKIAAMRAMSHQAYLHFMGVHPSPTRRADYDALRPAMSPAARGYFDAHPDMIEGGVLFRGNLERYLQWTARLTQLVRGRWVRRLFSFEDIAAQRRFVEGWNRPFWRFVAHTLCRRGILDLFSRDPGFWRFVPPDVPLHQRICDSIYRYLFNHLARESHLLQLVFFGRYTYEPAMPPYLKAGCYERIQAALATTEIRVLTGQIADVLRTASDASVDAFSITDVSSYLSEHAFHDLMDEILRTARPGARLCSRGIFVHRDIAPEHARRLDRDPALERQLASDDLAMIHEFLVAGIN